MEDKFTGLLEEVVRALTEKLLAEQYPLGKMNDFLDSPSTQFEVCNVLFELLKIQTAHSETALKLLDSESERTVFERQVLMRVYKVLYAANGGLT